MTLTIDNALLAAADLDEFRRRLATRVLAKLTGGMYPTEVLADGPSGYWRLGEASGTTAFDASGDSNHGIYSGGPTLGATGLILGDSDTAVTFDGVDDYIGSNGLLGNLGSNLGSLTVEFWIKTNTAANKILLYMGGGAAEAFEVDLHRDADNANSAGKTAFAVTDSAGNWGGFHIAANIYDNVAHHVVFQVADIATPSAAAWVDGVAVTVTTGATTVPLTGGFEDFTNNQAYIGGSPNISEYAAATLDEVAVYPTRLSGARILAHYEAGRTRPTPTVEELSTDAAVITALKQEIADAKSLIDSLDQIAP